MKDLDSSLSRDVKTLKLVDLNKRAILSPLYGCLLESTRWSQKRLGVPQRLAMRQQRAPSLLSRPEDGQGVVRRTKEETHKSLRITVAERFTRRKAPAILCENLSSPVAIRSVGIDGALIHKRSLAVGNRLCRDDSEAGIRPHVRGPTLIHDDASENGVAAPHSRYFVDERAP